MVLGASENEIALVAFLLIVVLLATKIAKIGERIGALFERGDASAQAGPTHAETAEITEEPDERDPT